MFLNYYIVQLIIIIQVPSVQIGKLDPYRYETCMRLYAKTTNLFSIYGVLVLYTQYTFMICAMA